MIRSTVRLLALGYLLALVAPRAAGADYLYDLWNNQEEKQPYVMVVLDTSGSMRETDHTGFDSLGYIRSCPYGVKEYHSWGAIRSCYQRIDGAQAVLRRVLPRIANEVGLGLSVFAAYGEAGYIPPKKAQNPATIETCGTRFIATPPSGYDAIKDAIATPLKIDHNTPIAFSLEQAHIKLKAIKSAEGSSSCREYYILLLTDGEENCAATINSSAARDAVLTQIRSLRDSGIRTFVVGFGKALTEESAGSSNTSAYARAGGTAVSRNGEFVCWDDRNCKGDTSARAMFAYDTDELERALTRSFDMVRRGVFSAAEPVIASVPQNRSEIDRVRRNFMVYSAFDTEGDQRRGHLYGLRLFKEASAYSNQWEFTDMSNPSDVLRNCAPDQTCVFDAGKMLADRVSAGTHPRKIITASPGTPDRSEASVLVPALGAVELKVGDASVLKKVWQDFTAITEIKAALADVELPANLKISGGELRDPSDVTLRETIAWLHGKSRPWPLGDIFHSSPAIVEPPSYGYRDRGYPQFRMAKAKRPWMIYVGANDGMIHAFYGSPDLTYEQDGKAQGIKDPKPRWQQGEEAWSYLPMSMIGRTMSEVKAGAKRFFSQDLSCRYTDIIIDDKVDHQGRLDCGDDPNCGWATILLCGQGWGGSWYVAIDVTEPTNPKPLWEVTIPGTKGAQYPNGIGRTWSLPSLNLQMLDGKPVWTALFGNGYNSDMGNCPRFSGNGTCSGDGTIAKGTKASYRMLNLPFEGPFPEYGDGIAGDFGHAWLQDVATGRLLKTFSLYKSNGQNLRSALADVASIDTDWDGFIDAAYVGGFDGSMVRIHLKGEETSNFGVCFDDRLLDMGTSKPITSSPAVVAHPTERQKVYLFVGSGISYGQGPDQQANSGNQWEFRAYQFREDGSSACKDFKLPNAGNLCEKDDWKLTDNARLMGAPLLSRQANGRDWLLYTSWAPTTKGCTSSGTARLACLDVTNTNDCKPCGDLTGDGTIERETVINTDGVPPVSPVVADGRVYVGPIATSIAGEDGEIIPPNSFESQTVTISWREVF